MSAAAPIRVNVGDSVWLPSGSGPFSVIRVYDKALLIRYESNAQKYLRGILMKDVIRVEKPRLHLG